jgi:hypothetical protein
MWPQGKPYFFHGNGLLIALSPHGVGGAHNLKVPRWEQGKIRRAMVMGKCGNSHVTTPPRLA